MLTLIYCYNVLDKSHLSKVNGKKIYFQVAVQHMKIGLATG